MNLLCSHLEIKTQQHLEFLQLAAFSFDRQLQVAGELTDAKVSDGKGHRSHMRYSVVRKSPRQRAVVFQLEAAGESERILFDRSVNLFIGVIESQRKFRTAQVFGKRAADYEFCARRNAVVLYQHHFEIAAETVCNELCLDGEAGG